MFELMDPSDETETWSSFVPPVPPDDETLVNIDDQVVDDLDVDDPEVDGLDVDGLDVPGVDGCLDAMLEQQAAVALVEFEESLEAARLAELDADATLAEAVASKRVERRVLSRQLWLASHWADLHAVLTNPAATGHGRERLVRLGGDGTPEVAEFAPAELGAVLQLTDTAAKGLIGDALDLRHRFPRLWTVVQAGLVEVWVARRTVQEARGLSRDAAVRVDATIAGVAGSLTWRRLKPIVAAAVLAADPAKARDDAEQAEAGAGVFLDPEPTDGLQGMFIRARAGDVQALDKSIELIARALKILGHGGTPDQRRAEAVGIIADPQAAQDLIASAEQARTTQREAAAARRAGDADLAEQIESTLPGGVEGASRGSWKPFAFSTAVLYYHLSQHTLGKVLAGEPFAGAGVVRVEDIGPVIADQVREWLQHANVTLKPVIDLPGVQPVDHYEVSPAMSEAIGLIRSADSFPYGTCTSRRQDNDHTIPYRPLTDGGPPGQTDPQKMSKMTRRHHRLKTHAGWTVRQLKPGGWLYRSPHGYHFIVDQHGTTALGRLC